MRLPSSRKPTRAWPGLALKAVKASRPTKSPLFELHGPAQTRGVWVDGVVQLVPVKRHGRFEAKGVTRSEAAGSHVLAVAGREECLPDLLGGVGLDNQLEAVLAGIAGAAEEHVDVAVKLPVKKW